MKINPIFNNRELKLLLDSLKYLLNLDYDKETDILKDRLEVVLRINKGDRTR
jgi:hypothetical protein